MLDRGISTPPKTDDGKNRIVLFKYVSDEKSTTFSQSKHVYHIMEGCVHVTQNRIFLLFHKEAYNVICLVTLHQDLYS